MPPLSLTTPTEKIFMIGPNYSRKLKKLNIFTAQDLLHHYPSRHRDLSLVTIISKIQPGETITIQGKVISSRNIYTRTGKKIQKAVISDDSGQIEAVWFNQSFIPQTLKPNLLVNLSGKADIFNRQLSLVSPEYEIVKDQETIHRPLLK